MNIRKERKETERPSFRLLNITASISYVEYFRHFSALYAFRGVFEPSNFSHTRNDHRVCNSRRAIAFRKTESTKIQASIGREQAIITHIIRLSIFSRLTQFVKYRAISARRVLRGFVKLRQGAHDASSPSLQRRIDISGSL